MKRTVTKRVARVAELPAPSRQQLIDAGCNPRVLDSFVASWNDLLDRSQRGLEKKDLDRFKTETGNVVAGLERVAASVEQLSQRKRHDGATWEQALSFYLIDTPGTAPPPDFLRTYAADIRQRAALLKRFEDAITRDWTVRKFDVYQVQTLITLVCYCREVTWGRATVGQIAALLGEEEPALRMRLSRLNQTYTPDSIRAWEQHVKDYIAACPSGELTFDEWLMRKTGAYLKQRTVSEVELAFSPHSPWYRLV